MNQSRVDVSQLQKRDPVAWTSLLNRQEGLEDLVVTAVTAQPLTQRQNGSEHAVTRYLLSLAHHSDPITFVGKRTTAAEARFYLDLAPSLAFLAPRPFLSRVANGSGWVVIDSVPNHVREVDWTAEDVEDVIDDMSMLHAAFWQQDDGLDALEWLPHFVGRHQKTYSLAELRESQAVYFDEGPGAVLSAHALGHVGRLAPDFLRAANGLVVMRALGGWPGVLGEGHLAAAADLLDDPVPMLEPLLRLPLTLLHGDPRVVHWRLTLFEERRLLDWRQVQLGPSVMDLVAFQERFDLLEREQQDDAKIGRRPSSPISEETMVDSYLLAMKSLLGPDFDARAARAAIPAARCLHTLITWFGFFGSWFDDMPDKYVWQRVTRSADLDAAERTLGSRVVYAPYLREVFERFLQAYRVL